MWIGAGLYAIAAAAPVADVLPPTPVDAVALGGLLGERLQATALNRLLNLDEAALLAGFRQRPGSQAWVGEHVGKFLHAATLAWRYTGDPRLRDKVDRVTRDLLACQLDDGYLGTYRPDEYWTSWDVWVHKYCLYGLLTVARETGSEAALTGARRIGELLCATFGEGRRDIIKSGTHVGTAATSVMEPMLLLYQATGERRYLDFCEYLVRAWDQPHGPRILKSLLDHGKVNLTANGKAYEMVSNLVGLCELYRATGNPDYLTACTRAWDDIAAHQCYLTGGTSLAEHFQPDGQLPNAGRVSENCAMVTWAQLSAQLLRLTGEAKYAAMLESLAYNHLLASQRPDLSGICYFTPLETTKPFTSAINCCTSSNPRGMMLLPACAWSVSGRTISALIHGPGTLRTEIDDRRVTVRQLANYPDEARLEYLVEAPASVRLTLRVRRPAGCESVRLRRDGPPQPVGGGDFIELADVAGGERLVLDLAMPAEVVVGTQSNAGLLAVRRGPVVYALDAADNPAARLRLVGLEPSIALQGDGSRLSAAPATPERLPLPPETQLVLRPYHGAGSAGSRFEVWLPSPTTLRARDFNVLMTGTESWSREGNVAGSIIDGDPGSWRVTFDGTPADQDWFAVTLPTPETISRVVFTHGNHYHDGGWFDASDGRPRIEVQRVRDGGWEPVATLDSYPATSATDRAGLQPAQAFEVRFAPVEVWAVRVSGRPACGDNPRQAFASCAELAAYGD